MSPTTEADDGDVPTARDLAEIGFDLGDGRNNPYLWTKAVRAMPNAPHDVGSEAWRTWIAAQVYGTAFQGTQPQDALDFADTMTEVYEIESLDDVDRLLGREQAARRNYAGHLGFVETDRGKAHR